MLKLQDFIILGPCFFAFVNNFTWVYCTVSFGKISYSYSHDKNVSYPHESYESWGTFRGQKYCKSAATILTRQSANQGQ